MSLTGKLALVTGSTSGIGLGIVNLFAKHGCDVILTGLEEECNLLVRSMTKEYGVQVEYLGADLLQKDQLEAVVAWVFGHHPNGVDILVNNAGFNHVAHVEHFPDETWDALIGIHLSAPFHLTKRFIPAMKRKGWGRIINMSSQMGIVSVPGKAVYSAAKGGLIGLTKGVALEVASAGITCNAVCPTYARTALFDAQMAKRAAENDTTFSEALAETISAVPTGKPVSIQQIADLVLFLVSSEASSQITGSSYLIDGGFTAQ